MSATEEKKFVIKHVFNDIPKLIPDEVYYTEKKSRFNVPWRIGIQPFNGVSVRLDCVKERKYENWTIETDIEAKLISKNRKTLCRKSDWCIVYYGAVRQEWAINFTPAELEKYVTDGNLTVEMHVKIVRSTGIKENLKNFGKSVEEFSDVVLNVDDQKFYLLKKYLASHSSYFESLFMGDFNESEKSEITIDGIDPQNFQYFLELIHGEPILDDDKVESILQMANRFHSKTAIRHCEKFLIDFSRESLKQKFHFAVIHKLDKLKEICLFQIKTGEDIWSILPDNIYQFDQSVYLELLQKARPLK